MVVHGEKRRPRALIEGFADDTAAAIASFFGSSTHVDPGDVVDESEYDVLVTTGTVSRSEHLHVLALDCRHAGIVEAHSEQLPARRDVNESARESPSVKRIPVRVLITADIYAQQLDVPSDIVGATRDLIIDTVVPAYAALATPKPRWTARHAHASGGSFDEPVPMRGVVPLLTTHNEVQVLAFTGVRWRYNGRGGLIVALPLMPTHPERWTRWFLDQARQHAPDAFPPDVSWHEQPMWTPRALRGAIDALEAIRQRWKKVAEEFRVAERDAEAAVNIARERALTSSWRLLTDQGDDLAAAVGDALHALGFEVANSDDRRQPNEPKMEDFRLKDSAVSEWVALVEVKGFTRGASPAGASQLMGRPVRAFVNEEGRLPNALLYIVNHLLETPPDQRPVALKGDSVVEILAEQGGALVDTRDLLRAVLDVENGAAPASVIRESIRNCHGRWRWPEDSASHTSVTRTM
ncbi:hypothetical protein [Georgenia faecalis]|uniref:hypothetical protein n=1 Tax=Georgenia faecalis TaxID=2483799 RepID=UPI000FD75714|nr:hypothetical protein [Georgenia faecalis]